MRWAIGILSVFFVLIGVNTALVYFAITSEKGLIEDRPYEKGIAYQEVLDQLVRAEKSGLSPQIEVGVSSVDGRRLVQVSFSNAEGAIADGLNVSMLAQYPASADDDIETVLSENEPGDYSALIPMRPNGRWLVQLRVSLEDEILLWKTSTFAPVG